MKNKWISLAQLAFKAHQVAFGSQLLESIRNQSAKLVIFSNDIGQNSKKKIIDKCTTYKVPYFGVDSIEFDRITNRSLVAFSILDANFAKKIWDERKGMVMSNGLQQTEEETESEPESAKKQQSPAAC